MDAISFCCTSWKWVPVLRGAWKHTFWDWAGSSWRELTKPTQGQSSWLCWYGSWTGQHTPVPNSPWQHYGSHNGGPSVIYLHVFKFIARAHALDTNFELRRWCGQMWYIQFHQHGPRYFITCGAFTSGGTRDLFQKVIHFELRQTLLKQTQSCVYPRCSFILFIYWYSTPVWANEMLAQRCKQSRSTRKRNREAFSQKAIQPIIW